jgi:tRNA U34 5-carboxymethylaminomethyl modifying enzyme MnmG/GidA
VHREATRNPPDTLTDTPLECELPHPDGPAAAAAAAAADADADADAADAVPTLVAPIARESVEIDVKYEGFVKRQQREVARMQRSQGLQLPEDINYGSIASLSCEEVEKLSRVRPRTLQEAAQISGVTPGCLSMLLFHLRKHGRGKQSKLGVAKT